MSKEFCIILIFLISLNVSNAQEKNVPKDYFRSPLDIPLILSGTFGELRPNHFHAGIDFKTKGASGLKIYSVADGYVSRIKVSPTGYGKAIYVKHPNGYTSVYAHIMRYNDKIEAIVKTEQYEKKSFAIEIFPKPNDIIVKKGEIIALSGNSGSSFAPHLHFELRDSKTEKPQNGMHFGFDIKDNIPPIIKEVKLYEKSVFNGQYNYEKKVVKGNNGKYYIDSNFETDTTFGISISTYDLLNGANNKNGVYKIALIVNDSLVYKVKMDEFAFSETKYIKSYSDFYEIKKNKKKFHKCFVDPNNKLSIYDSLVNNGFISFGKNESLNIKIIVSDLYQNQSILAFDVIKQNKKQEIIQSDSSTSFVFVHGANQVFKNKYIELKSNKKSFYDLVYFQYKNKIDSTLSSFSSIHQIHNHNTPIHNTLALTINLAKYPDSIASKLCLAKVNSNNKLSYSGGKYIEGKLKAKIYSFGDYTVSIDTIKPIIKGLNIYPGKTMKSSTLKMTIKDEFSGINTYEGRINGQWVIMEYDPKNNRLTHYFEKNLPKGKHKFDLKVTDKRENASNYEAIFYY
jgi:murein DD-endopeptidase MepM/ murein hydrolase activator NlpD